MDLQLFGENDTITSGRDLKLDYKFTDGDTRLTSIPNPRNNLTSANILTAASELKVTQAFVGDKDNGAFDTISSATIVEWTRTKIDLS